MRNVVKIIGNTAYIHINKESGERVIAMVDRSDLKKLREKDCNWLAIYDKRRGKSYAMSREGTLLHLYLFGDELPKGRVVDFVDGNAFNCRRKNIRFITHSQLALKRNARSDRGSGVKGVIWVEARKRWRARVRIKGKTIFEKYYDDLDVASTEIEEFRQELYKDL